VRQRIDHGLLRSLQLRHNTPREYDPPYDRFGSILLKKGF
jgi:hypothetical protein